MRGEVEVERSMTTEKKETRWAIINATSVVALPCCFFFLLLFFLPEAAHEASPQSRMTRGSVAAAKRPPKRLPTFLLLGEPLDRPPAAAKLRGHLLQRHRALGQVARLLLELVAQGDELSRGEVADVEAALVEGRRRGGLFWGHAAREKKERGRRRRRGKGKCKRRRKKKTLVRSTETKLLTITLLIKGESDDQRHGTLLLWFTEGFCQRLKRGERSRRGQTERESKQKRKKRTKSTLKESVFALRKISTPTSSSSSSSFGGEGGAAIDLAKEWGKD